VSQDDITQSTSQDDATLPVQHYAAQPQNATSYMQETISSPPPGPYYDTPTQYAGSSVQTPVQAENNTCYSQTPATLTQTTENTGYGAATPPPPPAQQKSKWSRKRILLLGGIIVLVLFLLGMAGAWLIPSLLAKGNNQASTPTTAASPAARARQVGIYAPYLARYGPTIRNQIAQGLHLTPEQLATQLRSGKTLSAIASAQGVSTSQLQTLVTNAFKSGLQPAVTGGNLTQQQVNALVRRMLRQPQALARFLEAHPKASASPTSNQ
jgi:hypothetical protein